LCEILRRQFRVHLENGASVDGAPVVLLVVHKRGSFNNFARHLFHLRQNFDDSLWVCFVGGVVLGFCFWLSR